MSAIINLVRARAELLRLNLKSGLLVDSSEYQRISGDATAVIAMQIGNVSKLNCEQSAEILKLCTEDSLFTQDQIDRVRNVVNAKLDQVAGKSNASGTTYQRIADPETWLPHDLFSTVTEPNTMKMEEWSHKVFRISTLAAFFGAGGLLHPEEYTSRDIVSVALLDVPDAVIVHAGVQLVQRFKTLVKDVARSHTAKNGTVPPKYTTPDDLRSEHPKWHASMYAHGKVPGVNAVDVVRLASVRNTLGCRNTKHSGNKDPVEKGTHNKVWPFLLPRLLKAAFDARAMGSPTRKRSPSKRG